MSVGIALEGTMSAQVARTLPEHLSELCKSYFGAFGSASVSGPHEGNDADEQTFRCNAHPTAEDVFFEIRGRSIRLSQNTSSTGPGFHAAICDFAKDLEARGVNWHDVDDDTGYWTHRDFEQLQSEFLAFASKLIDFVLLPNGHTGGRLCLPVWLLRTPPDIPQSFASPLGQRSIEWAKCATHDPHTLSDFFAWWDRGFTGKSLRNAALSLMWFEVNWTALRTSEESAVASRALDLLKRAHRLDATLPMPLIEWRELHCLCESSDAPPPTDAPPMASFMPIGYRRLITRYESFSQVTLTAEGSLTHSTDPDDPGLLHLWDEDTSIRVSVYRLPRTIAASEAQAYLRNLAIPENVPRPPTALGGWAKDQLESFATTSLGYNEADVPEYRIVNAYAVIGNRLAAMTCTFPLDWSNEWALSIATSLNMTSD